VGHLPTASSVFNLARTSSYFHEQISTDDYAALRDFVQKAFPSIKASPPWRDAAIRLTSRSRAWERRAFTTRECWNPSTDWRHLSSASKIGFVPAIDSYETRCLSSGSPSKEVLAHSAAGRLMIRVNRRGSYEWKEVQFEDDHKPENDILDLRLLRPHQQIALDVETIVYRRATGQVARVHIPEDTDLLPKHATFNIPLSDAECITVNDENNAMMAACCSSGIYVFPVNQDQVLTDPVSRFNSVEGPDPKSKTRCAKFLSAAHLAVGRGQAQICVYDCNAYQARPGTGEALYTLADSTDTSRIPQQATAMETLDTANASPPHLLISGWSDGIIRLYDTRVRRGAVAVYRDSVDEGQILSILPIGRERFVAGSSENGCLKTFDLRLPGMRPYSYRNSPQPKRNELWEDTRCQYPCTTQHITGPREFNIFVTPRINRQFWTPVSQTTSRSQPYTGGIHSLSSPSPESPTLYVGIRDHVMQIDFINTDDVFKKEIIDPSLRIPKHHDANMVAMSCYERPRDGHETSDEVLLRRQRDWGTVVNAHVPNSSGQIIGGELFPPANWDERWFTTARQQRSFDNW
jgi:WD40 repeat protein